MQDWTSLLPETLLIELPNYLLKLHKVCGTSRDQEVAPTEKGSGIGVFLLGRFPPPTGELNASVYIVKSLAPKR